MTPFEATEFGFGPDLIVMAVTSQFRQTATLGEVWLHDWADAGLLKPSVVKPVIATLEQRLVIRTLGRLSTRDQTDLRDAINEIIG
jgi:mRNA interferase MazF